METLNPKQSGCLCYWKPDATDIKSSGMFYKLCKNCRKRNQDRYLNYHLQNVCICCKIDLIDKAFKSCIDSRATHKTFELKINTYIKKLE